MQAWIFMKDSWILMKDLSIDAVNTPMDDKKTIFRVFYTLLRKSKTHRLLTFEDLATQIRLGCGAFSCHLARLASWQSSTLLLKRPYLSRAPAIQH